jgi:hypothetical protein
MKKRILTYLGMVFLACFAGGSLFAQVNMPYNPAAPVADVVVTAPIQFYDNGGPAANYSNNSNANSVINFVPGTAGNRIQVQFASFATEGSFDALFIYNGRVNGNTAANNPDACAAPVVPAGTCNSTASLVKGFTVSFGSDGFTSLPGGGQPIFSTSGDGVLSFRFRSDASVTLAGWTATVSQVANPCRLIPPANAVVSVGPNCGPNSATINVPTYVTAGCANGFTLSYRIDCGAPVVVGVIPTAATVTTAPMAAGIHSIHWEVTNGTCLISDGTSYVNVLDNIPPTITCPASLSFNLDAGECNQVVNYNLPTVSDNCPFFPPIAPVQFPASFTNHGSGGVFTLQGNNAPGGVFYSLTNTSATETRTINSFGVRFGNPAFGAVNPPKTMQIYSRPGALTAAIENSAAGWTNQGPQVVAAIPPYFAAGTGPLAIVPLTTPVVMAPGAQFSFFIWGNAACPVFNYTFSLQAPVSNGGFTLAPGTVAFGDLGSANQFQQGVGNAIPNINVNYSAVQPPPPPVQTAGLPPGSVFPVGKTTNCFSITDLAGNTASCCFDITVLEYPNPTQQLVCNDNVQISLDQQCTAVIGADDILEGGLYRCYDNYVVMRITAMGGTGPAVFGSADIGNGPHSVKVVDPTTGQSCWGTVTVEDKLPPVMTCINFEVDCTADLNDPAILQPAPFFFSPQAPIQFPASFVAHGGGQAFTLQGNNASQGDYWNITNNGANPIKIQGFGIRSPNPQFGAWTLPKNYNVWTRPTFVGFETNAAAWTSLGTSQITAVPPYFATGTGPIAQLVLNTEVSVAAGGTVGFHLFCPNGGMVFNYTFGVQPPQTNGILTLLGGPSAFGEFGPLFQAQNNTIPNIQVNFAVQLDPIPVVDNCTGTLTVANGGLTYAENFTAGQCGGLSGTVVRTWTAKDAYGNSTTCKQTITIKRPKLSDVDVPEDVQWTCEQYNAFPNITGAAHLHRFITDTDPGTEIINVNLDPNCDDLDLNLGTPNTQDNPNVNATNVANGGLGCPGSNPFSNPPTNGLDDADVLALTGSGVPTINGLPLKSICGISYEHEDLTVNVCPGTFKIIRRWTLIDWCANPVNVQHFDQVIKVVDDKAPLMDLFAVAGDVQNNYGTHSIPALGNGGGCNQEPQLSGGTKYFAHVQLPTGQTPDFYNNVRLQKLWLNVDHERLSDLDIFLKAPNGRVVEISSNNGGNGTKIAADFFDAATGNVTTSAFNTIGNYKPEGSLATSCGGFGGTHATFADFDDPSQPWQNDVLGNWELIVFDEVAQATGKVVGWKLFFTYSSLNVDVYDASAPQGGGPHAVCQGTVAVPAVDAYDNCSGVAGYTTELWTIVPGSNPALPMNQLGSVNGNGGNFFNVPLFANGAAARYIVRYYAVDGCGNQSFVETVITLRDKVPPVPNCISFTEVSIANDGQGTGTSCARVYAQSLDNASYDNCKPVYFLMAKMADATSPNIFNRCYYPYRDFCCNNIGDNQVILLVLDQDPTPFFSTLNSAPLGCDGTPGLFLSQNFAFNTSGLNFNTCMVNVKVSDKLPPVLVSCPPNQRISCDWYADNLETQLAALTTAQAKCNLLTSLNFGAPTYYDNCAVNTTCNFSLSLDQCLEGSITRSWTTTDNAGNTALQPCTQTIRVDHVSDWAVQFPADITVNCGANVPGFGEPTIFYETCELVAVSKDDQVFNVQGTDACYKIVRQWTVINWCVVGNEVDQEVVEQPENALGLPFPQCDVDSDGDCDARTFRDSWRSGPSNPNRPTVVDATRQTGPDTDLDSDPWDGYITYQQVIKVQDTVDPVFTNGCTIPDVCIEDNTCGATVLLPTPEVTECTDQYTVTVQIKIGGVWLNGFGPYLNVAPGTYEVRYVAQDYCNNQTQCVTTVTVKDCKKPTPYCKNGLVVELMVPSGMVDIWASDFDAGSFDNCPGALKLSFSANVNDIGNTYTCDDLGQNVVQIWVTDAAGNQDYCETFVIIQANMGQCDDDPLVAGTIANEGNAGVQNVSVNINSPAGFNQSPVTAANGSYGANVPMGGDYTVTPLYDQDPLNGVSTFDLVLISKHILGVTPLGSPYKVIAADANKSNSVTTFDLVEIRKLILFINSDFPNNTSWRFVAKSFSFPNASNPFATAFPEVININDIAADMLSNNFVAVKIGDVNGSAAVNLLGAAQERTTVGDLVFNADDVNVEAGKTYTVEFKATDFNVSGYQFSLNFDKKALEFVEVVPGLADASNFGTTMVNEGVLTASWNSDEAKRLAAGEVVFGLTFKAVQSGQLSGLVNITSSYTVAEAYNSSNELMDVALSFNNNLVTGAFDLYQNTPNPFASVTTIGFYLPEATSATLTISDVQGKVVKVINGDYSKGYNNVTLKRGDLGASGVLYYRLDTGSDSATRKMILVD